MDRFRHHKQSRCVLWTGEKHSGKTTALAGLISTLTQHGFAVGGILAPSIYADGELVGFDIVDIAAGSRKQLLVRDSSSSGTIPYRYSRQGLKLGHLALSSAASRALDLVIVDEFGPLELDGQGWRSDVDTLFEKTSLPILLVVRCQMVDKVTKLYAGSLSFSLEAQAPNSTNRILAWLKE